ANHENKRELKLLVCRKPIIVRHRGREKRNTRGLNAEAKERQPPHLVVMRASSLPPAGRSVRPVTYAATAFSTITNVRPSFVVFRLHSGHTSAFLPRTEALQCVQYRFFILFTSS